MSMNKLTILISKTNSFTNFYETGAFHFSYIEQRDLSSSTQRRHQLDPFESEDHTTYPHSIGSHLSTIHRE